MSDAANDVNPLSSERENPAPLERKPTLLYDVTWKTSGRPERTPSPPRPIADLAVSSTAPDEKLGTELRRQLELQRQISAPTFTVTLSWSGVGAVARSSPSLRERCKGVKFGREKIILRNVSGIARPGELIALMGASGAGKTTLLNVLANQNVSSLYVDGNVRLNGMEVLGKSLGGVAAYVQQEDLFVGTLTVYEHLRFQAALRMGSEYSMDLKMRRVNQVIGDMGLNKCKKTVIGIPGKIKGISGGEKKRLAFASEILTNPPLLFADEPTSGLDSFMAESVVRVLQKMAESGRTIICTIHQPSSEVFSLFDRLILLAEGKVAYHGSSIGAMEFFSNVGYPCPENYNPADFYVHTLAIVPGNEEECREKVQDITDKFAVSETGNAMTTAIEEARSKTNNGSHDASYAVEFSKDTIESLSFKASVFTQIRFVLWRAWLSNIRDPTAVKVKLGQALVISLLLGLMYLQADHDQSRVQNIPGAISFVLIQLSISSVIAVLQTFPLEMPVFMREHQSRLYRTSIFYLAKASADMPFLIIQVAIFSIVTYFMIGLNNQADKFFTFFGICIIVATVAISLGYLVSAGAPSVSVALAIGPVSFIPFLLFGGFFIRSGTVPVYLEWIQFISWFFYGFETLMVNEWTDSPQLSCGTNNAGCLQNGTQVLDFFGLDENNFNRDIGVLFALLVAFRLLAFIVLTIRVYRRER
ncbi:protein white-like [Oscarella lobularis]|uniref:protein white-like n=1 Tax=Oscarella lobularis TaxID=121494 RepID=UPI00331311AA